MEHKPNMDKGKKIDEEINEEYDTSSKRDRFEILVKKKTSLCKKARVEAPLGTSFGMDMAHNLTLIGSGAAASMSRDIPCNLACTGSGAATSTGKDVSENLTCAGRDAGTGFIFIIGSPEQGNTESMENQMERAENVNGLQHIGVISVDAVSGSANLNGLGCMHHTVTLQDLQIAMLMDPQLLGENWPVKMEELLSHSFE